MSDEHLDDAPLAGMSNWHGAEFLSDLDREAHAPEFGTVEELREGEIVAPSGHMLFRYRYEEQPRAIAFHKLTGEKADFRALDTVYFLVVFRFGYQFAGASFPGVLPVSVGIELDMSEAQGIVQIKDLPPPSSKSRVSWWIDDRTGKFLATPPLEIEPVEIPRVTSGPLYFEVGTRPRFWPCFRLAYSTGCRYSVAAKSADRATWTFWSQERTSSLLAPMTIAVDAIPSLAVNFRIRFLGETLANNSLPSRQGSSKWHELTVPLIGLEELLPPYDR